MDAPKTRRRGLNDKKKKAAQFACYAVIGFLFIEKIIASPREKNP
ncbi:hypothetical protein [Anoxybacillus mongoliensis]|nr:hypothetical protein [Anoxybacillus mongoliensis]